MNIIQWLETNLNIGIVDIESAAEAVGIDAVNGIQFLENVLAPFSADLTAAGTILSIVDTPLTGIVTAITQIEGLITASSSLTENLIANLGSPTTVQTDYTALQAEFAKFKAIEAAQIASIQKALALIIPIAIKAKSSTVAEIEAAVKNL